MKQYNVTGMSCAACSARVEKAVLSVAGVSACSVNLLTHSMGVEGTADDRTIIEAVRKAGYGASPKDKEKKESAEDDALADKEAPLLFRRLVASLVFLVLLMYVSMGHTMWGFPLPAFFEDNPIAIAIIQLLLSLAVMVINQRFFTNGVRGLLHRAPNMDTLVALGSAASFGYSLYALLAMTVSDTPAHYLHELYFESAAMILALITLGKMLEARAKGKTTSALKSLMKLAPKTATLLREDKEHRVPIDEVRRGDVFVLRAGESVPVDGVILEGHGAFDESALTGESIPVDKTAGDSVSAATVNLSGFLKCQATRVGEDTTLAQIIKMVSDAAATKAPIAKIADKVSGIFVPVVISIAVIVLIVWLALGESAGFALARAISILVISCPCALGLATPVAIMVGNGVGAKRGILFKTANALENSGKTNIVALDKTGTITRGEPVVTDLFPVGASEVELLSLAYSLEKKSEHPLARAIVQKAKEQDIQAVEVTEVNVFAGGGLVGIADGLSLLGGNAAFVSERAEISTDILAKAEGFAKDGKTPMFFARDGKCLGIIAVADTLKEDSKEAIHTLRAMGIRVVMLTGDNQKTAKAIADAVGVNEVIAEVRPDGKEAAIRTLQKEGKVAMVGDGINDAPALTAADTGIAIGAGTDVAIDAADVVLASSRLSDVCTAIQLSRATLRIIHQNLFWAFLYNTICIPVAAGAFVWAGLTLNPMLGAAAMSLSSFSVVSNALRLNLFEPQPQKTKKEKKAMTKTIKIEGMMCPHCEARVKTVLEALPEVTEAAVSHKDGTAVLTLCAPIKDEALTSLITTNGYTVLGIK